MGAIKPDKLGLTLAMLSSGAHAVWALLIAAGLAQRLVDFILWIHFIKPVFVVDPFDPLRAVILVTVTATVGFVAGYALALLWNLVRA